MLHHFKQGDRALYVYDEDIMEGIVQEAYNEEVVIQFSGISHPSHLEAGQLQYIQTDFDRFVNNNI